MQRQGVAHPTAPSTPKTPQDRQHFLARKLYVGEPCYLCDNFISEEDNVQYYGGPFVMHSSCINGLLEKP